MGCGTQLGISCGGMTRSTEIPHYIIKSHIGCGTELGISCWAMTHSTELAHITIINKGDFIQQLCHETLHTVLQLKNEKQLSFIYIISICVIALNHYNFE